MLNYLFNVWIVCVCMGVCVTLLWGHCAKCFKHIPPAFSLQIHHTSSVCRLHTWKYTEWTLFSNAFAFENRSHKMWEVHTRRNIRHDWLHIIEHSSNNGFFCITMLTFVLIFQSHVVGRFPFTASANIEDRERRELRTHTERICTYRAQFQLSGSDVQAWDTT